MPRRPLCALALALGLLVPGYAAVARLRPAAPDAAPVPRVAWTGGKVVGSPEPPPPFRVTSPFPKVKLEHPLHLTHEPTSGRMFVTAQAGAISSFIPGADAKLEAFFDPKQLKFLDKRPDQAGFETVYGLAFHPKFAENRTCFVCYTLRAKSGTKPPFADGSRVSKFKVLPGAVPVVDYASEVITVTFPGGGHNGGDLHFGPDGMLYISTGDAADPNPPDVYRTGQDITDLLAGILRVDVDHPDAGKTYGIPKDNPFVGVTQKGKPARGEVWAFGLRNPWRMSFDRGTGELWVGDVGWELWEMVHKPTRGSNHGWSIAEGPQAVNTDEPQGPTPIVRPVIEIPHTAGASMTGGYVYQGKKFPELVGQYIFGDWETRRIWAAKFAAGKLEKLTELVKPSVRVVAFGEDRDGELFFLDYDVGTIHSLERNPATNADAAKFPRTLSASGLYADAAKHTLAPGVLPYAVTSPQWQDFSTSEHYVALPDGQAIRDYVEKRPLPGDVSWHNLRYHFPVNSVLVKTISLETEHGKPESKRRVETQLLHFDGQNWNPYTYMWRDDQSDADLVRADGAEKQLTVAGDPAHEGGIRRQTWQFTSRAQCYQCHNSWADYTLGFNADQLNRPSPHAGGTNQLKHFAEIGVVTRIGKNDKPATMTAKEFAREPKLADPKDTSASLTDRAKGYFHANCGHCHRFGGGGAVDFQLHGAADPLDAKLLTKPMRGTFDLPEPKVVAPGNPGQSVVMYRMAKFGGGRMPHLGAELPDPTGLSVIGEWMQSAKPDAKPQPAGLRSAPEAIRLALKYPAMSQSEQATVRAEVAKLPAGNVRELFAGYLPQTGEKKLGPGGKADSVLALAGNAESGEKLLRQANLQCLNCHKLGDEGKNIGPDLTAIGKTRPREHLIESILEPSKKIESAYIAHVAKTADGRVLTGTIVKKTPRATVLRTAEGIEITIPADDLESITPSRESLMPSGLIADLTPQQAADLVEALFRRK